MLNSDLITKYNLRFTFDLPSNTEPTEFFNSLDLGFYLVSHGSNQTGAQSSSSGLFIMMKRAYDMGWIIDFPNTTNGFYIKRMYINWGSWVTYSPI